LNQINYLVGTYKSCGVPRKSLSQNEKAVDKQSSSLMRTLSLRLRFHFYSWYYGFLNILLNGIEILQVFYVLFYIHFLENDKVYRINDCDKKIWVKL